ncbi:Glutamate racemase [Emticicia oligotrophica DSM 17448]|uniref:Glutamate racemase n=1 Tax=Emticicia oligotrophica (strain DSM 17448 / CIP 109782 / MTCC 6937 / GPTSA100-15) TaxID=929562 RepID=A0ABN4ARS3_EMTOG|nr:glutamate racemase [Emticicia oligotrophica]AFK05295.1 Glutamate racemase [Emticicia oligotrophica DSM 17448]
MIGVFDSGIGGLTLLHEIIRQLPNEQYCYYADTENVPYSTKTEEQIKEYVDKAVNYFLEIGVKAIVLACNTATNVCVEDLRTRLSIPIIAIQPAVKVAIDNDTRELDGKRKHILVCATPITLRSARFQRLLDSLDANNIVERMALPELVRLAEKEDFGIDAENYILETLKQIDIQKFGSIVLGCTHFTYFEPIFYKLAPQLSIFDGNEGTARHLKNILNKLHLLESKRSQTPQIVFIESGKPTQNIQRFERYMEKIEKLT